VARRRPEVKRLRRNALLRARGTYDYTYTEWINGPTALPPEPELDPVVPLDSIELSAARTVTAASLSAG
jgi:hypothetical protein